jgi:hypothetical protein
MTHMGAPGIVCHGHNTFLRRFLLCWWLGSRWCERTSISATAVAVVQAKARPQEGGGGAHGGQSYPTASMQWSDGSRGSWRGDVAVQVALGRRPKVAPFKDVITGPSPMPMQLSAIIQAALQATVAMSAAAVEVTQ